MNIVLLGAPASGKGTQAEMLAKKFNLYYFQTGKLSRELAKKDARIKKIVDSGKLIPEQEMTMHVIDFLAKNHAKMKNTIFEGFPRFISQYKALSEFLKSKGDDIDLVISLDISEKEAIRRLSGRRMDPKTGKIYNLNTSPKPGKDVDLTSLVQREDDKPESIKVRFKYYRDNTKKLIDYLEKKGDLARVDGERPIDEIQADLVKLLKKVNE